MRSARLALRYRVSLGLGLAIWVVIAVSERQIGAAAEPTGSGPIAEPAAEGHRVEPTSAERPLLSSLRTERLVPWCIVPFDAQRRGPVARAQMLVELGLRRCAYDWRDEHVATFEDEIRAYRDHGIEFFAFWGVHEDAFRLFEKYELHPQIWLIMPTGQGATLDEQVADTVRQLQPIVRRTRQMGCPLGLYNHGGWSGEPAHLAAVCAALHRDQHTHVGIVYNFHHGHAHIPQWSEHFRQMQPYLLCVNLNGMQPTESPKILGLGQGQHELQMLRVMDEAGYSGPVGIIDHRPELDARESLQENLRGLDWLRAELVLPGSGGPAPVPQSEWKPAAGPPFRSPLHGTGSSKKAARSPAAQRGTLLSVSGEDRTPPLTVSCQVTLPQADGYHILVASETKASGQHWELFTHPQSGWLAAYLPGYQPDHVHTQMSLTDGQPHVVTMVFEPGRVRLWVDDRPVADQVVQPVRSDRVPGDFAIGRLVEGGLDCRGVIDWVHLSQGAIVPEDSPEPSALPRAAPRKTDASRLLWQRPTESAAGTTDATATTTEAHSTTTIGASNQPTSGAATALTNTTALPYRREWAERLVTLASQRGNSERGAEVFLAAKSACVSCHRWGSVGGQVGPDLTRLSRDRQPIEIVESLFWPQKDVKPEYVVWQIVTTDGELVNGYRVSSNAEQVVLRDLTTGRERRVPRDKIDEEVAGTTPMPAALMAGLSRQQQLDLLRFLMALGQPDGPSPPAALKTHEHESVARIHGKAADGHADPSHKANPFQPVRTRPRANVWPHAGHPVNRDRLYDFYIRQAEHYRRSRSEAHLLTAFPGLDGGQQGHWGNQNEQTWADGRWNETDLGSYQGGVFAATGRLIGRGLCVRVDDGRDTNRSVGKPQSDRQPAWCACFDPMTATYPAVWSGEFLEFSAVRHGFVSPMKPRGELVTAPRPDLTNPVADGPVTYLGCYRHGSQVAFAYRIGQTEYLDVPAVQDGRFVRTVAPMAEHPDRRFMEPGPAQWPESITTQVVAGTGRPYAIDTIELPTTNPWRALLFVSAHDFLSDGTAVVATMQGDVWLVSGLAGSAAAPQAAVWRRFASGLHHPLGLVVQQNEIYVQCRDQLLRLHDRNRDGEADFYECFSQAFETSPAGHDFICGLERDQDGRFYTASGNQGLVQISPDGRRAQVVATGFRNPDGLGLLPDGTVTVPCSEGEWTPASMVCAVTAADRLSAEAGRPPHFGYRGPIHDQPPHPPLVYLPRGLDNSSGGQIWIDSDRFGPLSRQLIHTSFGAGSHFLLLQDSVDGQRQGAVVPLPGEFLSGVHRGRVGPHDGQLYLSGMAGWGSYTQADGCFQRVRYTGDPFQCPIGFHVCENGVIVHFALPVDRELAEDPDSHFAQCWNYRYSSAYGSPELSPSHPGVVGHDRLLISSATVLPSGRSVFLEIPDLQPVSQLQLRLHVNHGEQESIDAHSSTSVLRGSNEPVSPGDPVSSTEPAGSADAHAANPSFAEQSPPPQTAGDHSNVDLSRADLAHAGPPSDEELAAGHDLFITVHRLDEPFTEYPLYVPLEKVVGVHPLLRDLAGQQPPRPNPFREPIDNARALVLETATNLAFARQELRVVAGEPLQFTLKNPDVVPHNWALVGPGMLSAVGDLANRLIADPEAVTRQYIPDSAAVLAYTDVVPPGGEHTIFFRAPPKPGRYPYLCTFPGHWMVMNGTLIVEPAP
jgi:putative heme-binding domain-containing protein